MSRVIVTYKVNGLFGLDESKDEKLEQLATKLGGHEVGGGSGFGERDLEYEFDTHLQANDFVKRCEQDGFRTETL
jgi:hypothetical protein